MQKTDFYVYIFLDPRKGNEPFYVGKGQGDRWEHHARTDSKKYNRFKQGIIDKIKAEGLEIGVVIPASGLTEEIALLLEKKIIKGIGRRGLKLGPLTNLTDGGEGISGYRYTDEQRKKMSLLMTPEKREHLRRMSTGRKPTPESLAKQSAALKAYYAKNGYSEERRQKYIGDLNVGGRATAKPVWQISQKGELLRLWPSALAAERALKIWNVQITDVANGNHTSAGGYYWRRPDSPDIQGGRLENLIPIGKGRKACFIETREGCQPREWRSANAAALFYKGCHSGIKKAAKTGKPYCGSFWALKES